MITTAIIGTLTWIAALAFEVSTNPTLTTKQLIRLAAFYALTWPAILAALGAAALAGGLAHLLTWLRELVANP